MTEYVEKSYNKALAADKRNVAFALLILQRRLASSVRAARRSLERRKVRLEELLELGKWLSERGTIDEDALEDSPEAERLRQEEDLVERLTAAETREELQAEIETLDRLVRLARDTEKHEVETKLSELRKVIADERIQQTQEKLLIFTESRDTLEYLAEKLRGWGYAVVTLHGGMNLEARIRAEHEFQTTAQVMVSTEAGGEGINLHWACALMVNYDIPWNPNRLEQRMGRIHRYGQQKEVHIYNLVAADTREGIVLQALFTKIERIQAALGSDRVFDVIGETIAGRTLQELIVDAVSQRRTLEDIVAEINAVPDEQAIRKAREATLEMLATRHIDWQRVLGEDRRARENRLVPEYIERFFERACTFAGISLEQRRDGLWRVPSVPYELRNVSHAFKMRFGEVFREYPKIAFDKQTARQHEAVFVAPGHPLLEATLEHLLEMCESDVRRGAVFADPDGQMDGWLWFIEGEVRDGADAVVGKRLFAIYQTLHGAMRVVNSSILWDLKPMPHAIVKETPPSAEAALTFAVTNVLEAYRRELAQQRERDAEIKRKYGLRSLEQMIGETDARLIEYETRRIKGDKLPEVEVQNEERRREELRARKQALEEDIRRETSLLPALPQVLGVVRVMPRPTAPAEMRYDPETEAIGMRVAMQYEREHARLPEDVSSQNWGYDIRSSALASAAEGQMRDVRYIEVKAFTTTGAITLTPNEWLMAQRLGDEYWLYIVENAKTAPLLRTIQNPAAQFQAEEVVEIVRYVIKDWKDEPGQL